MAVYIILFALIIFCVIKYDIKGKTNIKAKDAFFLCCFILSFVAGLRYHIGSDTANYIDYFEVVPTLGDFFKVVNIQTLSQPLWYLLLSIIKTLFRDYLALQLIHSFVVNLLIGRFIYKLSKKPFVTLLAYYCCCWWNFSFEIMRESLCVALYLTFLYSYVENNSLKRFILSSIPLAFIHMFAFIPIILTIVIKNIKYKYLLYFGFLATMLIFISLNSSLIMKLLLLSEGFVNDSFVNRVTLYTEGDKYGFKSISALGYLFIIITSVIYPLVVSKSNILDENYSKMLVLFAFVIILRMRLLIFVRICNYWEVILFVYAVNYIVANKKSILKLYVLMCFLYSMCLGINTFLTPQDFDHSKYDCRYVPYSSYIEKSVYPYRESLYY